MFQAKKSRNVFKKHNKVNSEKYAMNSSKVYSNLLNGINFIQVGHLRDFDYTIKYK